MRALRHTMGLGGVKKRFGTANMSVCNTLTYVSAIVIYHPPPSHSRIPMTTWELNFFWNRHQHRWMNGWMDRWMDAWMHGWMHGWIDG